MAEITAAAVKALREKTGLPMMDCKRALGESNGDIPKAIELLRKAGAKSPKNAPAVPPLRDESQYSPIPSAKWAR